MSTETIQTEKRTRTAKRSHDLSTLADLDGAELGRLYAGGHVASLAELDGHPRGRMLAIRHLESGPLGQALRATRRRAARRSPSSH